MGVVVIKNTKIAIKEESTEGTYEAPASGADYIQAQDDSMEVTGAKETLELNTIGTGLSKIAPRNGLESASGSIGMYMKAGSAAGTAPEWGVLAESLLGSKRSMAAALTTDTGHTTSTIYVSDTDDLNVGDIVVIKEAGEFHTSPISAVSTDTSITLAVPAPTAPSDNVDLEAFTTYVPADSGHPAFSVSKYLEDVVLEQATGCKTTSMSLEGFTTGQVAALKFGFEGANYNRSITSSPYTPSYDTSETPVILDACVYQDGVMFPINDFTLNVENSVGWLTDTCNGKVSSRMTNRTVSGTINPYTQNDSVANFTKFDSSTPFSLVVTAHNPSATAGEYSESISFYMPVCKTTEFAAGDKDGLMTDAISFSCNTDDGTVKELYISVS